MTNNEELPFCECGCGLRVTKPGNRFINNHHNRKPKLKPELKLCACGCGEFAKPGNRFIFGHHRRGENYHNHKIPQLCECGCGEYTLPGDRFIFGHHMKGKKLSSEICSKISRSALTEKDPLPCGKKIDYTKIAKNRNSPAYLGCFVAEQVLSKIFKDVKMMPYGNHGYDFICGNGYKIDVKSCATGDSGSWLFIIKRNMIPDYFLCIAFDNREYLNPIHLWLIPGKELNKSTTFSISKCSVNLWAKYEQPLDKVILCCDEMRGE